jgi:hypothetical protein
MQKQKILLGKKVPKTFCLMRERVLIDEEELDIEKASEQSLLAPLALQAYLAFVMHLHANAKKDLFVEKKRNKI